MKYLIFWGCKHILNKINPIETWLSEMFLMYKGTRSINADNINVSFQINQSSKRYESIKRNEKSTPFLDSSFKTKIIIVYPL